MTTKAAATAAWQAVFKLHDELFAQLSYHLPKALLYIKVALEKRLTA